MNLYIIRHAWAEAYGDPQWPDDTQRPLTKKGRKRFATMVNLLCERGVEPSIIATSPMVRCQQTAQIMAENLIVPAVIAVREELLPHGDLASLIAWTAQQAEAHQKIAWIGHAPDVGRITASLIGQESGSIHFAKGAMASVCFDSDIQNGEGELRWLVTAKLLFC